MGPDGAPDVVRVWAAAATRLGRLDAVVLDWVTSPDFDRLLVDTVRATYPPAEHDRFVAHFRGLVGLWVRDAHAATQPA